MRITISGTPGTGKTTTAKLVSEILNLELISLTDAVRENELYTSYDERRKSFIVSPQKVRSYFSEKKGYVLEGVVAYMAPSDFAVVLRTDPKVLRKRLEEKGYSKEKIEENVEAEKLDVVLVSAVSENENVIQIDTTHRTPEETARIIVEAVTQGKRVFEDVCWLEE